MTDIGRGVSVSRTLREPCNQLEFGWVFSADLRCRQILETGRVTHTHNTDGVRKMQQSSLGRVPHRSLVDAPISIR